jgi:hypothetical protein
MRRKFGRSTVRAGYGMGRRWRAVGVGLVAVSGIAAGCAFGRKPYTDDPLLTRHHGVWGNRERAGQPDPGATAEPAAPPPPSAPLIGSPLVAVHSPPAPTDSNWEGEAPAEPRVADPPSSTTSGPLARRLGGSLALPNANLTRYPPPTSQSE